MTEQDKNNLSLTKILEAWKARDAKFYEALAAQDRDKLEALCVCGLSADMGQFIIPVLDKNYAFRYKGYNFWLASCNMLASAEDLDPEIRAKKFPSGGVFYDIYICFMDGLRDNDGHTHEEYLKLQGLDSTDCWCCAQYVIPNAWSYGAEYDLKEGATVNRLILDEIDAFLDEHGDL